MGFTIGPGASEARAVRIVWVFALLAAVAVGAAISAVADRSGSSTSALPFLLILALVAFILWWERLHRGIRFFSPLAMFLILYSVLFALVPLADLAHAYPLTNHPAWARASWLAVMSLALTYLGYLAVFWMFRPTTSTRAYRWSLPMASFTSLGLMTIAVAALLLLLLSAGGLGAYVALFRQRTLFLQGHVYLILAIGLAGIGLLVQMGNYIAAPSRRRLARIALIWLPAAVLVSGALGARFRVVEVCVACVAAYHLGRRPLPRSLLIVLAIAVSVLFVFAGVQRNFIGARQSAPSLSASTFYDRYLVSHDLGEFREFTITLEGVPSSLPFQEGKTFLSIVPGLPFTPGGTLYSRTFFPTLYSTGTSISPSLPGELYMNFGLPGIIGGMILFGVAIGALESYWRRHQRRVSSLLVYCYSILPAALILRGDFTSMVGYYIAGLVPLWIAARISERRSREPVAPIGSDPRSVHPLPRVPTGIS